MDENKLVKSKKYRFYRKPSIRKVGPEVKHTKTSLARILKANPLLKQEKNVDYNRKTITDLNGLTNELDRPLIQTGGGAMLMPLIQKAPNSSRLRIPSLTNVRVSSSDFNNPILSSTLISSDDDFLSDKNKKAQIKKNKAICKDNDEKEKNYPKKRKSISSQFLERKEKEVRALLIKNYNNKKSSGSVKRRSRSLESSINPYKCCRIEEEIRHINTEARSEQNLSTLLLRTSPPNRYGETDEENKENIEDPILVETDSYEDLCISP